MNLGAWKFSIQQCSNNDIVRCTGKMLVFYVEDWWTGKIFKVSGDKNTIKTNIMLSLNKKFNLKSKKNANNMIISSSKPLWSLSTTINFNKPRGKLL